MFFSFVKTYGADRIDRCGRRARWIDFLRLAGIAVPRICDLTSVEELKSGLSCLEIPFDTVVNIRKAISLFGRNVSSEDGCVSGKLNGLRVTDSGCLFVVLTDGKSEKGVHTAEYIPCEFGIRM